MRGDGNAKNGGTEPAGASADLRRGELRAALYACGCGSIGPAARPIAAPLGFTGGAQEFDDLLQVELSFVAAGHVLKGDADATPHSRA